MKVDNDCAFGARLFNLSTTIVGVLLLAAAPMSFAQDEDDNANDTDEAAAGASQPTADEQIVVTGSRLK